MKCPECEREIAALKARIAELEAELIDERHRHDRYVDFELAQAKELAALKRKMKEKTL